MTVTAAIQHICNSAKRPARLQVVRLLTGNNTNQPYSWTLQYGSALLLMDVVHCPFCGVALEQGPPQQVEPVSELDPCCTTCGFFNCRCESVVE